MKRSLSLALLMAALPVWLHAQPTPTDASVTNAATAAFAVDIQAPDAVREVLERHLELLRYRELTDLSDEELARLLVAARKNAQDLVATMGYFSPTIDIDPPEEGRSGPERRVKLRITPRDPSLVTEVNLRFIGAIEADPAASTQRQQITIDWPLRPGMRFTQAKWDAAKQQALRQLSTQRYPVGQIGNSLADIDPASRSAALSVTLDSGPAYRLGPLLINGNVHHDRELVERLARLSPGADYQQADLVQAQQRLVDSGYFDSAYVALDTSGDPQAAPVTVQLREAPLQKLVLGIGASTDSGARFSVEHTHRKVPRIGWRAVSKLTLDQDKKTIGTELTGPPDEENWRWAAAAQLENERTGSFDVNSQRLHAGRSQNSERFDRNYYLQYDRSRTAATAISAAKVADALSANVAFTMRNFDSIPFPSSGWGLGLELGGGMTLGAERDPYGRVRARWLSYYRLAGRDDLSTQLRAGRISLRAEAGAVVAKEGTALPTAQLFLAGGDNSVRGYGYQEIGAVLPSGLTTSGRYLAVGSVEWQRPITFNGQMTDWESTVFIDTGAVADAPSDLRAKVGIGAGVRLKSPVGPLKIDLAYGVDTKRFRLHLNVGFTF